MTTPALRPWTRVRYDRVLVAMVVLLWGLDLIRSWGAPSWTDSNDLLIIGAFALAVSLGEMVRLPMPGGRESAPLSTAAGLGFAMVPVFPDGVVPMYGGDIVFVVTVAAMAVGAIPGYLRGGGPRLDEMMLRAMTVGLAGFVSRDVSFAGATLVQWDGILDNNRWLSAMAMVLVSGAGFLLYVVGAALVTSSRESTRLGRTIRDEFRVALGVTSALSATGALIALAARPVGLSALPLYLVPLLLTQFAVRRQATISATYRQTIRSLSQMTDVGGYTSPHHAERVAALSVSVGRDVGMRERELRDLEFAALLHDIGQVALFDPIPGGATVLAAPADQRRIAADGAQIVREAGVLDAVADIIEAQTHQFRQVRELGEDFPMESRIIKVVNAFDDLTGGTHDRAAEEAAVERIYLGLGYEYDPRVVESLLRVLVRRA